MRLCDDIPAEWVTSSKTAQLAQELVRSHVIRPGSRHGLLQGAGVDFSVALRCESFNAAKLSEGVDAVVDEGGDELLD